MIQRFAPPAQDSMKTVRIVVDDPARAAEFAGCGRKENPVFQACTAVLAKFKQVLGIQVSNHGVDSFTINMNDLPLERNETPSKAWKRFVETALNTRETGLKFMDIVK